MFLCLVSIVSPETICSLHPLGTFKTTVAVFFKFQGMGKEPMDSTNLGSYGLPVTEPPNRDLACD